MFPHSSLGICVHLRESYARKNSLLHLHMLHSVHCVVDSFLEGFLKESGEGEIISAFDLTLLGILQVWPHGALLSVSKNLEEQYSLPPTEVLPREKHLIHSCT